MWPCQLDAPSSSPGACAVDADAAGLVAHPNTTKQLCDRVIADDAVLKLRLAAAHRAASGQPFFLAAGFRKPHLPFRFPAPFRNADRGPRQPRHSRCARSESCASRIPLWGQSASSRATSPRTAR